MRKSNVTQRGLSRISKKLKEELVSVLSIHTWHDKPEYDVRIDNQCTGGKVVIVSATDYNMLSNCLFHTNLEEIQRVLTKYRKYGDDIYYTIEVEPRVRHDKNNDIYWIHIPVVSIYINMTKKEE